MKRASGKKAGVVKQVQAASEESSAELAYKRADAWARSAPGTPYGAGIVNVTKKARRV